MPWIDKNGNISLEKPSRYRQPDKLTLTSELVTDQMITDMGWTYIETLPNTETATTSTTN